VHVSALELVHVNMTDSPSVTEEDAAENVKAGG